MLKFGQFAKHSTGATFWETAPLPSHFISEPTQGGRKTRENAND